MYTSTAENNIASLDSLRELKFAASKRLVATPGSHLGAVAAIGRSAKDATSTLTLQHGTALKLA